MNKKKFIGLIIMMMVSLTGIIWVQIVWIRSALEIRNENFSNSVMASLNNAAEAIESSRKINFFNEFMLTDLFSISNNPQSDMPGYVSVESYSSQIVTPDTIISSDSVSFIVASAGKPGEIKIAGRGESAGNDPKAVYIRQNEFLEWLKRRASEFQTMSEQMIAEVFQWEKTLELDNREIDFAIRQSLTYSGINAPFEYAVIKDGVVQEGSFTRSGKGDFLKSNYIVRLFPDNIIRQDLLLSVVFPGRTNYILGSMSWLLGGSLLFSFIILATFGLSLFFIIRQKKISDIKSDFINNITHEFKTPIATIQLAADTIVNPKVIGDEYSIRHFISMIRKENTRMNKKVETILQIASLDKKEIEFRFDNISLHTIIERVADTVEIQVQQKNGRIKLNLSAGQPVLWGDPDHLTNLVNNLLDNAIKYSPESPDIKVETKNNSNGIILSVEDRGIGMSKSVQSKIFERFYRQTSGEVHDVKGFGLGLNYVRAIIDAHKGTISVSSEPGKGSRFEIFLPFNSENQ